MWNDVDTKTALTTLRKVRLCIYTDRHGDWIVAHKRWTSTLIHVSFLDLPSSDSHITHDLFTLLKKRWVGQRTCAGKSWSEAIVDACRNDICMYALTVAALGWGIRVMCWGQVSGCLWEKNMWIKYGTRFWKGSYLTIFVCYIMYDHSVAQMCLYM